MKKEEEKKEDKWIIDGQIDRWMIYRCVNKKIDVERYLILLFNFFYIKRDSFQMNLVGL